MENSNQFTWEDDSQQQNPQPPQMDTWSSNTETPTPPQPDTPSWEPVPNPPSQPPETTSWEPIPNPPAQEQPPLKTTSSEKQQPNPAEWDWKGPEEAKVEASGADNSSDLETNIPVGISTENYEKLYGYLGNITNLQVNSLIYHLDHDNKQIIQDTDNSGLVSLDKDNDSRFKLTKAPESELKKALTSIAHIAEDRKQTVADVFFFKIRPGGSSTNIFRGKPKNNFIYFVNAKPNSGDVVLDLSSVGGPSQKAFDSTPSVLAILEGWIPYSISKNNSDQDLIAIAGSFK